MRRQQSSTHTFLLYLRDCADGGETELLHTLASGEVIATCAPRRGRLLLFPHACPHAGRAVRAAAKLLLRGEIYLPSWRQPLVAAKSC